MKWVGTTGWERPGRTNLERSVRVGWFKRSVREVCPCVRLNDLRFGPSFGRKQSLPVGQNKTEYVEIQTQT
eukprot:10618326-Ditylum_brightwellii.AAC.1